MSETMYRQREIAITVKGADDASRARIVNAKGGEPTVWITRVPVPGEHIDLGATHRVLGKAVVVAVTHWVGNSAGSQVSTAAEVSVRFV